MFWRHCQLDYALKEVFRRLLFLVVPMVTSTILSTGMFQVAGKNILSYRRIFDKFESVKILSCLKILVTVIH